MTPDTLRRAAMLIRERAEKATPGPWDYSRNPSVVFTTADSFSIAGCYNHGEEQDHANATHIAALHPAVAQQLATWLEHEADRAEHQPWTDDVTEQALAFATAYLGEAKE